MERPRTRAAMKLLWCSALACAPACLAVPSMQMKGRPLILLGSFHKTGTHLMRSVITSYNQRCDPARCSGGKMLALYSRHMDKELDSDALTTYVEDGKGACIVFVRHPMEVIVSGVRYHLGSHEPWLHVSDNFRATGLPGLEANTTYQKALNQLSPRDRITFEMRGRAVRTINGMLAVARRWLVTGRCVRQQMEDFYSYASLQRAVDKWVRAQPQFNRAILLQAMRAANDVHPNPTAGVRALTYHKTMDARHIAEFNRTWPDALSLLGYD
mmetsp:Transcript_20264/g.68012  ORF Transcript_20264/g.68012 Transcript_20264/m.68012 type:complete len:270 (-) Transcript_20264:167-976(-)